MVGNQALLVGHLSMIEQLYDRLRSGADVAPGERLRLEGRLELLLELGVTTLPQLAEAISALYRRYFNEPVDPIHWQWMDSASRVYLPCRTLPAQLESGIPR